jgi:hypothetical protein
MAEKAAGEGLANELRALAREHNPVAILKELDKEKLLRALSPKLTGTGIDWNAIAKMAKAAQLLAAAGMRAPSFPLFLEMLTQKLPAREKAQLYDRLRLSKADRNAPAKLQAEAKRFAKEVTGKAAGTPTKLYQLLSKTPADILLLIMTEYSNATIQSRLKTYFTKYLPARAHAPEKEIQDLGVKPGTPRYQKIRDAFFYASIEGELRTPNQQQKFLTRMAQEIK